MDIDEAKTINIYEASQETDDYQKDQIPFCHQFIRK